jgi:hypothetical protein
MEDVVSSEFLDLKWHVAPSGYQWVRGHPVEEAPRKQRLRKSAGNEPSWYLVPVAGTRGEQGTREYDPFTVVPPLFRQCAQVRPNREQILAFADQFGQFGRATEFRPADGGQYGDPDQILRGEPQGNWSASVELLHRLTSLWDLCEVGDVEGLSRHVYWEGDVIVYSHQPLKEGEADRPRGHGRRQVMLSKGALRRSAGGPERPADTHWFTRMPPGELVLPTLVFLQREINAHLEPESSPRLLWNPATGALNLTSRPTTLLGMLWLQFAGALSGKVSFHECPTCRKWVRIGQDSARTNRRYCSNACRTQGLRARQSRARELHGDGRTVESIAAELDSDIDTVTRWVGAATG